MTERRLKFLRPAPLLCWLCHLAGLARAISFSSAASLILLFALVFAPSAARGAAAVPGTAPVSIPTGGFGIDGDLLANTPTNNIGDWVTNASFPGAGGFVLFTNGTPVNPLITFHVVDLYASSADDNFAGGDKVHDNPSTWAWTTNPVGSKVDINNAILHVTTATNGHQWAVVSGDRQSDNGDAYIDFEFLQNTLTKNPNGTFSTAGPHGGRTVNDFILTVALTKGGTTAGFFVEQWRTNAASGGFDYFDVNISTSLPPNSLYAAVNTNDGTLVPYGAFGTNAYLKNTFAEGGLDLTALIGAVISDPCTDLGIKTVLI